MLSLSHMDKLLSIVIILFNPSKLISVLLIAILISSTDVKLSKHERLTNDEFNSILILLITLFKLFNAQMLNS